MVQHVTGFSNFSVFRSLDHIRHDSISAADDVHQTQNQHAAKTTKNGSQNWVLTFTLWQRKK